MKLRVRGNSIRLRLTKTDVERVGETGSVGEMVEFGAVLPTFRYELHTSTGVSSMQARFEHNCLSISVPVGELENWITSEQIGVEVMQPIGDKKFLRILVEKDFACLTLRENEDETDAFTNPLAQVTCG